MKAAAFDLSRPADLAEASAALTADSSARLMAGGQSLGPMLNLRLARPSRIVPIGHLPDLQGADSTGDAVTIGACVTHAAIEDGRTPDIGRNILARIAGGIAYRAIRNRGTIGGSLAHADPAADWPCTLTALDAEVITWRAGARQTIRLRDFWQGSFRTALETGEIVSAIRIPRPGLEARWAYVKTCRKPGEFAHAMAAVLDDSSRGVRRAVIGAAGGPPIVLEGADINPERADHALAASGLDPVARRMQIVVLRRALESLSA